MGFHCWAPESKDDSVPAALRGMPAAAVVTAPDGRLRRRAVFGDAAMEQPTPSASDSDSDPETGAAMPLRLNAAANGIAGASDGSESESGSEAKDEDEEDDEGGRNISPPLN